MIRKTFVKCSFLRYPSIYKCPEGTRCTWMISQTTEPSPHLRRLGAAYEILNGQRDLRCGSIDLRVKARRLDESTADCHTACLCLVRMAQVRVQKVALLQAFWVPGNQSILWKNTCSGTSRAEPLAPLGSCSATHGPNPFDLRSLTSLVRRD